MDQLDIFTGNVRPTDPDTSWTAAAIDRTPLIRRVEAELRRHPDGVTDWELTELLGLDPIRKPTIGKRRQDLEALDTGRRRPSPISGLPCVVWTLDSRPSEPPLNEGAWMTELVAYDALGPPVDEDEARRLTELIKRNLSGTFDLVKAAHEGRAWVALGYPTWASYCSTEFGSLNLKLPAEERQRVVKEMYATGMSFRAIAASGVASLKTVETDLAGVANYDTCDERTTTGTDGKKYTRKKRPPTAKARVKKASSMAAEGYTSRQIGEAIGVADMSTFRRTHGIEVPADAVVGKTARHDPNRIVEQTVSALEADVTSVALVDLERLDVTRVDEWVVSLNKSLRVLGRFRKQLEGMTS